ncbi:endo alpha-1,4 polygalactosaminidase [Propioniciclava soli]|uniref:endo alpha-1,4 polygalactosaminidase n=1 Tax=Propioniciclava soli TaxID=2775081 RepID=UPI001E3F9A74
MTHPRRAGSTPTRLVVALVAIAGFAIAGCGVTGCAAASAGPASPDARRAHPTSPAAPTPADTAAPVAASGGPSASPAAETAGATPEVWAPEQGAPWQIAYAEMPALEPGVGVYDVDGEDAPADWVAAAEASGARTICYVNAGGWEDWRSDADAFPAPVLGEPLDDWEGERWLDTRQLDVLLPIMTARLDACAAKGFDAVDPDNVDGYGAETGFDLTRGDTVAYVRALAEAAHARGLSLGLKNAVEVLPELGGVVDFAVNEECVAYAECDAYAPMLADGKAVFHIEYAGDAAAVCAAVPAGFSTVLKDDELTAAVERCG